MCLLVVEQVLFGYDTASFLYVLHHLVTDAALVKRISSLFGDLVQSLGVHRSFEYVTFLQNIARVCIQKSPA